MTTLVLRNGKFVDKAKADPLPSDPAFYVISDTMVAIKHHGTGQITDSKAKFRRMTRASGCIEIGNEAPKPRQPIKLDRRQRAAQAHTGADGGAHDHCAGQHPHWQ